MFPLPRRGLLRHQVPDLKLKHVSLCRYWNGIELLSMRVFTALSAAVYKKSLTLSSTGRNQYTAGQVRDNNNNNNNNNNNIIINNISCKHVTCNRFLVLLLVAMLCYALQCFVLH